MDATVAIATEPNAQARISAVAFEASERTVKAAIKFDTREAKQALIEATAHREELSAKESADHERVLMTYVRPSRKSGAKAGERVVIPAVSQRELPVYYASNLAEQRIKHEMVEGRVFKLAFIVDVDVDMRGPRVIAYRVTQVHNVMEIDDEP